jgi:hypothetical protein
MSNKRLDPKSPEHKEKIRQALLDRRSRERSSLDVEEALGKALPEGVGTQDQHEFRVTEAQS